jgi:O-antigen/teichoic acid export membrane protein
MAIIVERITSQRAVAAGIAWNLFGRGLPILVALAVTPALIGQLGVERWGLYTLGLALTGMAGLFDLGVGVALTRALAECIGHGREDEAPDLIVAAAALVASVSLPATAGLWLAVPAFVDGALSVAPELRSEAVSGLRMLVLAVPAIVAAATMWGVLAAYQSFRTANLVSVPLNALSYVGPLLVLRFSDGLVPVMGTLAACRYAAALSFALFALRLVPRRLGPRRLGPRRLGGVLIPLFRSGAWSTVGTVVGSLMVNGDRFLVGALASLSALSYYATPLDLVLRFSILTVAVSTSLAPAVTAALASDPQRATALLLRSAALLFGAAVPAATILACFAPELLLAWLGSGFSAQSSSVLRLLAVGMLVSCMTTVPNTLLVAAGRFDLTAKLLLAQPLLTIPLSVALIHFRGCEGAATAYCLRQMVSFVVQGCAAWRLYRPLLPFMPRLTGLVALAGAGIFLCTQLEVLSARALAVGTMLCLTGAGLAVLLRGAIPVAPFLARASRPLGSMSRLAAK